MADRSDSVSRKTISSGPTHPAHRRLWDFWLADLDRQFGPKIAYETLGTVFLNVAIRSLGKKGAIADLRRMAALLEGNETTRTLN